MRIFALAALAVAVSACNQQAPDKSVAPLVAGTPPTIQAAPPSPPPPKAVKTYEGPFGLAMGISVASLQEDFGYGQPVPSSTSYFAGTPPRPVNGLSDYFAIATDGHGVCRVGASVDVGTVNGSGDQLKAEADKLAAALEVKYGKPTKKYDFSKEDVYVRNPEYWMQGLKKESAFYGYTWKKTKEGAALPNDIDYIEVDITATSFSAGYASIRYTFTNFKGCGEDMRKAKASNL